MADSGKQRLLEQFRDASEGERRSDYGGDQIEDATLYAGRVMTRGAEAFVRSRMAELASMRLETAEPTLYDLPFDLTAPPEVTAPAELSPPVSQTIPELPPATPEVAMVPAKTPAIAEVTAPLELPPSESAAEKPVKRRRNTAPESFPVENSVEKQDESWTPAYRDLPTEQRHSTAHKKTDETTLETSVQEYGNSPKGKSREASHVRKTERTVKTHTGGETVPAGERRIVKEKGRASAVEPLQNAEAGRQKFIRERGREAAAQRTEAAIPERHFTSAHTDLPTNDGLEPHAPQTREHPVIRAREADTHLKDAVPDRTGGGSERITVRTRVSETQRQAVSHNQPQQQSTRTAEQGKRELIRERSQQIAARRIDAGSSVHDSPTTPSGTQAEIFVPNPPETRRVATQSAEVSVHHPAPSNANMPPQTAVQGEQNGIQERTVKIAEKPVTSGQEAGPQIKTNPSHTGEEVPAEAVRQDRAPVKTREAYVQRDVAFRTRETPQATTQGKQKVIRERAVKITEKTTSVGREPAPHSKSAPYRIGGEEISGTVQQERMPVKTREAYVQRETPPSSKETPRPDTKVRQKLIREPAETAPKGEEFHRQTKPTPNTTGAEIPRSRLTQVQTPVKTKETYAQQKLAPDTERTSRIADRSEAVPIRGRTDSGQVSIKTKDAYTQRQSPDAETTLPRRDEAVPKEAPKELRKTVRTREGLIQSPEPSAETAPAQTNTPDGKAPVKRQIGHPIEAPAAQTEPVPPAKEPALPVGTEQRVPDIKTRTAYARREAAFPQEQTEHTVEQGRQKFLREQKRKADAKRAAERRPKIREAQLPVEETETASDGAKNLAIERVRQAQNIRTKEAGLRQQGLDGPKEQTVPELPSGKAPEQMMAGNVRSKLVDGLPETRALSTANSAGGKKILPALPGTDSPAGSIKTRMPPARFIREKGKSAAVTAENAAGQAVRGAASGGGKVVKSMRPVVVKEAGKAAGKTIKTAGDASKKVAATAGTASAKMVQNAKQAAQSAAKAKAVRDASARTVKRGAKTVQDAAQAVAAAVKAAAASLQSLIAGLSAGGGAVLVVMVVICLIGLLVATPFGLFLSGQLGVGDNIQTAVSQLAGEYNTRVQEIQDDTPHDELDIAEDIPTSMMNNWRNVLSVYAVRVTTDELSATEVVTLTEEKLEVLRETFWDMNQLDYYTTSRTVYSGEDDDEGTTIVTLHISTTTKNAEEMAEEYDFDERQKGLLEELLSPEYDELFDTLLGSNPALVPGDLDGVLMPGDVSETRRQIVATGSQLLGRVHYFWGGKSLVLGWDSRWGTPKRVWAAGSPSTGTVRPFGLDCSGFVDWVFYNVSGGTYVIGHGGGASAQHRYCTPISWSEAQPGDLAFYPGDSHVGIIVGYDEAGNVKIMHCSSGSYNGVVLTGRVGFSTCGRPLYLQ